MLPNTGPRTRRLYAAAVAEGPLGTKTKVKQGKTVAVVESKERGQRRGPAAKDTTTTLATKPSTSTIQPTTNTPSVKATAHKAPVTPIASRTRTKTTTVPTTTMAPEAPKSNSANKGPKKVLDNNPGTADSAPPVPQDSTVTKKKRPKAASKKSIESADTDDSDPDAVKKPAKKKVQRYQGPNGSTIRRIPMHQKERRQTYPTIPPGMTEEEYSQAIKSSSNKVLYDLLARNDCDIQELTVRQHKVKLLTWQVGTSLHILLYPVQKLVAKFYAFLRINY
jgi:hypothetical protein